MHAAPGAELLAARGGFEAFHRPAPPRPARRRRREQTLRWAMIDQLRSPPAYFAEVIKSHFRLRGDAVLATCRRWAGWCREKGHSGHGGAIERMTGELEAEVRKLQAD